MKYLDNFRRVLAAFFTLFCAASWFNISSKYDWFFVSSPRSKRLMGYEGVPKEGVFKLWGEAGALDRPSPR